jgi:hypothetical protein
VGGDAHRRGVEELDDIGQRFLFQAPSEYIVGGWPFRARKFKATEQRMIGKRFTCLGMVKELEAAESRNSDLASFLLEGELGWQKSAVCQRDFGIHCLSGLNVRQKCQVIQGSKKNRPTFQVRRSVTAPDNSTFCQLYRPPLVNHRQNVIGHSEHQLDFLTILSSPTFVGLAHRDLVSLVYRCKL